MRADKKKIVIAGAGQMGMALAQLIDPNRNEFLGFGDNDSSKWNEGEGDYPVFSMEKAIELKPDEIIVSPVGEERARMIGEQLKVCRFYGKVTFLRDMYGDFSIRSRCLKLLVERLEGVEGAAAELGVFRGDMAWQINMLMPQRKLYLFDTFKGFDSRDLDGQGRREDFSDTSVELVLGRMPYRDRCVVKEGYFPESAEGVKESFAFVSLDPDLYEPVLAGLEFFYPRLEEGGMILLHDYNSTQFDGVKKALKDYETRLLEEGKGKLKLVPLADLHGSCVIVK